VAPTARVEIENAAVVAPAATVTLAGSESGSLPDNDTTAPPSGAAPVRFTEPVSDVPPTTVNVLTEIEASATDRAVTVSVGDCLLLPLSDAVMAVVPAATPTTTNVALEAPAAIVIGDCTVATAGLLLDSAMLAVAVAAAERLTVPCPLVPAAKLVAFSATPDTTAVALGPSGELDPPH
jgi:hypothetical protein